MDCLLVSAGSWTCALPIECLVETMRALPTSPCASVAAYVRGVSVIRGSATVVLDLAAFLAGEACSCRRLVLLRSADRPVALGVDALLGIRSLSDAEVLPLRGVLTPFAHSQVRALQTLDGGLVALLAPTLVLPDELARAGQETLVGP